MSQPLNSISDSLKNIQLVVFDLDGTLYDQRKLRRRLYFLFLFNLFLGKIDIPDLRIVAEFRKQREKHKGCSSASLEEDQFGWCVEKTGMPVKKIKETVEKLMFNLPLRLLKKALYPNVVSFIDLLRQNAIKTAVYSDYPVVEKLSALGIKVDRTFCSTHKNIAQLKPSKKGLDTICEVFKCDTNKAVYIGDREDTDGESARMAGVSFIKVHSKQARKGIFYGNLINLVKND
jgi:putative hydrolase of the HAD superfamily